MTAVDRTPQSCLHPRANHQHGTRLAYCLDRCRCQPCCAANSEYEKQRSRAKAYGRPTTVLVDAEPVRAHVQAVLASGVGWKRLARVAQVHSSAVSRLLYGRRRPGGRQEPPTKRMRPEVAQALLAVPTPEVRQLPGGVTVDGTGTRRRLQALAIIGWSIGRLAVEADVDRQSLDGALAGRPVLARNAQAVAAVYDRLWNRPPTASDRHQQGGITRTINQAKRADWASPLAWDDESIDDPQARPNRGVALRQVQGIAFDEIAVERSMSGDQVSLRPVERAEVVHRLTAAGYTASDIAARVGIDARSVQRIRDERRRLKVAA